MQIYGSLSLKQVTSWLVFSFCHSEWTYALRKNKSLYKEARKKKIMRSAKKEDASSCRFECSEPCWAEPTNFELCRCTCQLIPIRGLPWRQQQSPIKILLVHCLVTVLTHIHTQNSQDNTGKDVHAPLKHPCHSSVKGLPIIWRNCWLLLVNATFTVVPPSLMPTEAHCKLLFTLLICTLYLAGGYAPTVQRLQLRNIPNTHSSFNLNLMAFIGFPKLCIL